MCLDRLHRLNSGYSVILGVFFVCFFKLAQHLSLQSCRSFCMSTSSFFKLPNDIWSLDESFPSTMDCTCKGLRFAPTLPCILSPYVPVYLTKSVSVTSADTKAWELFYFYRRIHWHATDVYLDLWAGLLLKYRWAWNQCVYIAASARTRGVCASPRLSALRLCRSGWTPGSANLRHPPPSQSSW